MVWQIGVLLVGIGVLLLSIFASFILLNMTRSLRTIEAILTLTLDEARLALPELRHSLQQVDDMVSGVNDKFTAADRAMNATGAAISGWGGRGGEVFWRARPPSPISSRPASGGNMRENRVRHQPATTGHEAPGTVAYVTELKLP